MRKVYKYLNPLKTSFFNIVTSAMKNHNVPFSISNFKNDKIKILITRPNHRLGNQLLLSPLIQEIHNQIPNCEIDLLVSGMLSQDLYKNYDYINVIHNLPKKPFKNPFKYLNTSIRLISRKYYVGISVCEDSNSGKIFLKLSRCKHKIYDSDQYSLNKPKHIAKYPVYNFTVNQDKAKSLSIKYPKMDLKLSEQEIKKGKEILQELFSNNKKTIVIFTYATGNKMFSKQSWQSLYEDLQESFSGYNILEVLPKENVSQVDFSAVHYYSQDLREIAAIIENTEVFIGADSGMMHLAVSTSTTTIGLFSVTDPEVYEPYGNKNISISINEFHNDDVIKEINKVINSKN